MSFAQDLIRLRGTALPDEPEFQFASMPGKPPFERLFADSEPLSAAEEATLMGALTTAEAELFVSLLRHPEGRELWDRWRSGKEAQALKNQAAADLLATTASALAECLESGSSERLRSASSVQLLLRLGASRGSAVPASFTRAVGQRSLKSRHRWDTLYDRIDQVRGRLVRANLRLVWRMRANAGSLPARLILLHGVAGLVRAIDSFDANQDARLPTYASWWIRARLVRARTTYGLALRETNTINEARLRLRKLQREARIEGRQVDLEGVRAELQVESDGFWARILQPRSYELPLRFRGATGAPGLLELRDLEPALQPEVLDELASSWSGLAEAMEDLTERERHIIVQRLGLESGEARTLSDISDDFGLSRERIRQLETQAKAKLALKRATLKLDKARAAEAEIRVAMRALTAQGKARGREADSGASRRLPLPEPPPIVRLIVEGLALETVEDALRVRPEQALGLSGVGIKKLWEFQMWVRRLQGDSS